MTLDDQLAANEAPAFYMNREGGLGDEELFW
jgi:hypothetical protein